MSPAGPTTTTPIELTVMLACQPSALLINVIGTDITITAQGAASCGTPRLRPYRVRLPRPLDPGEYRVNVTGTGPVPGYTTTFIVRDAGTGPLRVAPSAIPTTAIDGLKVRITGYDFASFCQPAGCMVLVDGVDATGEAIDDQKNLWFVPPARPAGLSDIAVVNGNNRVTLDDSLYYFSRNAAPPNRSMFERILFPLLVETPGANGSRWITEAAILNPQPTYVENYNEVVPFVCVAPPCGERLIPGQFEAWEGGEYPYGATLFVPRSEAGQLSFSLRARDTSRAAEGFGTEIPVVRESDMYIGTAMTLLQVPLAPGYRAKLRVYAYDLNPHAPQATVTIISSTGAVTRSSLSPQPRCLALICETLPIYYELDLPSSLGVVDVYVDVEEPAQAWSFITVTNNATQQVTTVTPDGRGGVPCTNDCGGPR